ncbi:MAG: ComEC/Rec2 family competence protein, partial [Oscillospiraceae bacterium]
GDRYIFSVARTAAKLPASVLYMENPIYIGWMGLAALLFAAAWFLRGKHHFRPAFPAALAVITLCFAILVTNAAAVSLPGRITVLNVGQGQSIVMLAGGATVMIDCGGEGTSDDPGETAAEYLLARGRRRVDVLVLTHLHEDHVNGVMSLMALMPVEKLVMAPDLDDSDGLLEGILESAREDRTEVCYVGSDTQVSCGDIRLMIYAPRASGDENERGLIIRGSIGAFDALITGDAGATTERELVADEDIGETELLVVGHHGSRYSTGLELMEALRPKYAVISVGYNHFGHPTAEAIARATGFDAELYRTDLNGNVTFNVGEYDG